MEEQKMGRPGCQAVKFIFAAIIVCTLPSVTAGSPGPGENPDLGPETIGVGRQTETLSIPLRVHVGESRKSPEAWVPVLEEINRIWSSQAGICFEARITRSDKPAAEGLDIWFSAEADGMNGYYVDAHDIRVREHPVLAQVVHPAAYPAARTAAHELGHALGLPHRQDSDENLMRSMTLGWQLNRDEVRKARTHAETLGALRGDGQACSVRVQETQGREAMEYPRGTDIL